MERLTTDNPKGNLQTALNLFYAKDGTAWVRGGGPEYEYQDVPLFTYIRSVIQHQALSPHIWEDLDDETLAEVLTEWLFDGHETTEGIIATLYTAAWAFAELRARLKDYEDTGLFPYEVRKLDAQRKAMAALADSYKAEIPQWNPVAEGLPDTETERFADEDGEFYSYEVSQWLWGIDACGIQARVRFESGPVFEGWYDESGTTYAITHWMPMPDPPEEVQK